MANHFPAILVTLTFLPVGMFMGCTMCFVLTGSYAMSVLHEVKYWPFVVGGVAAILTGGLHVAIKEKYKQYKFEHMYFQMAGVVIFFITSILMLSGDLQTALFLGFIAHGIIYVSSLSYINIRTGKTKYRHFHLSLPHLVYLIGIGLSTTLILAENRITYPNWGTYYGETSGALLMVTTILILLLFPVNEILQYNNRSYNYKQSLDNDFNRENINKEILKHKYFHISPLNFNFPANVQLPYVPLKAGSSGLKEFGLILYALASKVLTLMFFYYPFLYLLTIATLYTSDYEVYIANWIAIIGMLVSIAFIAFISYKITYLLSIIIKIFFMVVLLIFFASETIYWNDMKILFWFVFMGINFGFSHPDINILSYTNLRSNELILAAGYFIEHLIIGVIQYETVFYPENLFGRYIDFNTIFAHAITFIVILSFIGIIGIFVIPNKKHNSLLEIKNTLNKCDGSNHVGMSYNAQQNPELHNQRQNYPNFVQNPPQVQPMPYHPNNNADQQPYTQNMFQNDHSLGQANYSQQKYLQNPQQTSYINIRNSSQIDSAPGQFNNPNSTSNYPQFVNNNTTIPGMMYQQNFQRVPPNIQPFNNNSDASLSQNYTTIPGVAMMYQPNFQHVPTDIAPNFNSYAATPQIRNNPNIADRFLVNT